MMNNEQIPERYSRQQDIVPRERFAECKVTVVGVGAIGRQVALQVAAMGVSWLQLLDDDKVEPSNLASQGYLEEDLGVSKVDATASLCWQINSNLEIEKVNERFRRSMDLGNVLFNAVDSIETRRLIWNVVKDKVAFYSDGRMSAEVLRVLSVSDITSQEYYPSTLFAANEAYVGPCTAKTTIFCANIAAGLMVAQFAKWLRRLPLDADIQVNLLSMEMNLWQGGDDHGKTG
jgi:hypothetical protein